jgi:hypothetical protein
MLEHMAHLYTYEGLALLTYRYYYPGYVPGRVILSVHSVQASRGADIDSGMKKRKLASTSLGHARTQRVSHRDRRLCTHTPWAQDLSGKGNALRTVCVELIEQRPQLLRRENHGNQPPTTRGPT